jgi:DNA-binding MarR family transcriptional regulator
VFQELTAQDYVALAEFRHQIRCFLHFSQEAALKEELEPQQHQLLLAVRAQQAEGGPTIGQLAEQLLIRHHSAVGLVDRLAEHGLIDRVRGSEDRREVRVRLTALGESRLNRLSVLHRDELRSAGPRLVTALEGLLQGLRTQDLISDSSKEADVPEAPESTR